MVNINLTNKTISLRFSSGRKVSLVFEGDAPYFYLLFTALVVREMKKLASKGTDKPFVSLRKVKNETWLLAKAVKRRPFETEQSMARSIYGNWPRRFTLPGTCFFKPHPELNEQEELRVVELFERARGKTGLNAEYRISRQVREIKLEDPEVLENLIQEAITGCVLTQQSQLPYYVPDKPFYKGLEKHKELIIKTLKLLEQGPMGQVLQIWGMGGIGKSTIAAEIARRYTNDDNRQGILWIQLQAFSSETSTKMKSLQAQIIDTLLTQLGLLDRLNEAATVKFSGVVKEDMVSRSLLVIDNFDPAYYRPDELVAVLEKIQPKRAVITSRPCLDLSSFIKINVPPLDSRDGICFLQTDAKRRKIDSVLPKTQKDLTKMCKVTGGLPFAMQLALGQATRLPWRSIVERCIIGQAELYYYLFRDLWKTLDDVAKKTLVYMRTSPDSIELDELLATKEIGSPDQVFTAVNELVKLALVNVKQISESSGSYGIHPLTHHFLMTDLPDIWSEEDGS